MTHERRRDLIRVRHRRFLRSMCLPIRVKQKEAIEIRDQLASGISIESVAQEHGLSLRRVRNLRISGQDYRKFINFESYPF